MSLDSRPAVEPGLFATAEGLIPNPRADGEASYIFLGSTEDFADDRPEEVWLLAEELLDKLFPGANHKEAR